MSAPFGIEIFSHKESLQIESDYGGEKYAVKAPRPHPSFENYITQVSDTFGVVWVKALAPPTSIDAYGNSLRTAVDKIAEQVNLKYGSPEKTDFLLHGAMWDEPQYWMNALQEGQRYYSYVWKRPQNQLEQDLESIFVGAAAFGGGQGGVIIEYASTRMADHEKEIETKLADLF
ncbi:MAG TPA: hypothetical protein VGU01_14725 [Sphingomicrobium sp.]|nr:hypothetical protein [Sphingomicrobium sp.]